MLQICSVKDKTVVLLSTFASGNDLLTVHKDKSLIILTKCNIKTRCWIESQQVQQRAKGHSLMR